MQLNTIGLDLAKNVFQVHVVTPDGTVVTRQQLRRSALLKFFGKQPRSLVGMEACASAHYWARELSALGHEVRLMPPPRVKAYVPRGKKNDAVDAAAIAEAVTRPSMSFVPVKTVEQQSALMLHRTRQLLVEARTRASNAIRGQLGEFGITAAQGAAGIAALLAIIGDAGDARLPKEARQALTALAVYLRSCDEQVEAMDRAITGWHRASDESRRVATIPQIGPITASALVATAGEVNRFDNARQFAAWLGLVPSQNSSGGKASLGPITKSGDRYLRQLLIVSAIGMIRLVRKDPGRSPWFARLLARGKPPKLAAVALANKMARIAWVILARGGSYRAPAVQAVMAAA
jgi:transposase